MKNILYTISILLLIVLMDACKHAESYPPEPQISLNTYSFADDTAAGNDVKLLTIKINFTDGDGDLFTPYEDTTTLRGKAHLTIYKKVAGDFVQVPDSFWKVPYTYTFPYDPVMDRNGQNKTQKGAIEFSTIFFPGYPFDTIQVGVTVMDMSFHQSNEVKLPKELILK